VAGLSHSVAEPGFGGGATSPPSYPFGQVFCDEGDSANASLIGRHMPKSPHSFGAATPTECTLRHPSFGWLLVWLRVIPWLLCPGSAGIFTLVLRACHLFGLLNGRHGLDRRDLPYPLGVSRCFFFCNTSITTPDRSRIVHDVRSASLSWVTRRYPDRP